MNARTLQRLCDRLEDSCELLEYERDDALARVAELEDQLADLQAGNPRPFAKVPFS